MFDLAEFLTARSNDCLDTFAPDRIEERRVNSGQRNLRLGLASYMSSTQHVFSWNKGRLSLARPGFPGRVELLRSVSLDRASHTATPRLLRQIPILPPSRPHRISSQSADIVKVQPRAQHWRSSDPKSEKGEQVFFKPSDRPRPHPQRDFGPDRGLVLVFYTASWTS